MKKWISNKDERNKEIRKKIRYERKCYKEWKMYERKKEGCRQPFTKNEEINCNIRIKKE